MDVRFRSGQAGFTLIEIMVVIAMIAAILAIGAPKMFNSASAMRTSIRELAISTREIRNVARLTNTTQRLVISINDEKGHTYWVESASGTAKLLTEDQLKELEGLTSAQREDEAPKNAFQADTRVVKSPRKLPRGLFFESVEYGGKSQVNTAGPSFIHFFPQGLAEEAAIHITDRKTLNWTITIHPLTGRAEVFERNVSLKDLRRAR